MYLFSTLKFYSLTVGTGGHGGSMVEVLISSKFGEDPKSK